MNARSVIDGIARQDGIRPVFQPGNQSALSCDIRSWVDRRLWKAALEFFDDPFRVTKDIGADLERGARR